MPPIYYSMKEKKDLLNYIIRNRAFNDVKGRKFWQDFSNSDATTRSWQSLKEVFLKKIFTDLYNPYYALSSQDIQSLKMGYKSDNRNKSWASQAKTKYSPLNVSKAVLSVGSDIKKIESKQIQNATYVATPVDAPQQIEINDTYEESSKSKDDLVISGTPKKSVPLQSSDDLFEDLDVSRISATMEEKQPSDETIQKPVKEPTVPKDPVVAKPLKQFDSRLFGFSSGQTMVNRNKKKNELTSTPCEGKNNKFTKKKKEYDSTYSSSSDESSNAQPQKKGQRKRTLYGLLNGKLYPLYCGNVKYEMNQCYCETNVDTPDNSIQTRKMSNIGLQTSLYDLEDVINELFKNDPESSPLYWKLKYYFDKQKGKDIFKSSDIDNDTDLVPKDKNCLNIPSTSHKLKSNNADEQNAKVENSLRKNHCKISIFKHGRDVIDDVYVMDTQKADMLIDVFKKKPIKGDDDDVKDVPENSVENYSLMCNEDKCNTEIADIEESIFEAIHCTKTEGNLDDDRQIFSTFELEMILSNNDNPNNNTNKTENIVKVDENIVTKDQSVEDTSKNVELDSGTSVKKSKNKKVVTTDKKNDEKSLPIDGQSDNVQLDRGASIKKSKNQKKVDKTDEKVDKKIQSIDDPSENVQLDGGASVKKSKNQKRVDKTDEKVDKKIQSIDDPSENVQLDGGTPVKKTKNNVSFSPIQTVVYFESKQSGTVLSKTVSSEEIEKSVSKSQKRLSEVNNLAINFKEGYFSDTPLPKRRRGALYQESAVDNEPKRLRTRSNRDLTLSLTKTSKSPNRAPLSNSKMVEKESRGDLLKVLKKSKVIGSSDLENLNLDDMCLPMSPPQYEECAEIGKISNSMIDGECQTNTNDSLAGIQLNISSFSKICVANGDDTMFQFDDEIQVRKDVLSRNVTSVDDIPDVDMTPACDFEMLKEFVKGTSDTLLSNESDDFYSFPSTQMIKESK
ncbi:uncharacterized protein LOC143909001 [Arctopsyche grandis]|uniref:uncharacterized protein LOC143909001 n=1 Tax=Arctopsyche grandis TaxID=121162 RepID=UPI00406D9A4D